MLDDLDERGLLKTTLVVLAGEFGRTPRVNAQFGRDHYCSCFSALVAGAGLRGGAIYGRSDNSAAFPADRPVSLEDFSATLLTALGVPSNAPLDPSDFTRRANAANRFESCLDSSTETNDGGKRFGTLMPTCVGTNLRELPVRIGGLNRASRH